MKLKFIYVIALIPLLSSAIKSAQEDIAYKLLTTQTNFEAGSNIVLMFESKSTNKPQLYLSYGYGSTLINPNTDYKTLNYKIPPYISSKAGVIAWKLLIKNKTLDGQIKVFAQQKATQIETYLGPTSIEAGGRDYSMLVAIPTDKYDNTLKDGTAVKVKHQFLKNINESSAYIKNGISYKNIYSKSITGRILASSNYLKKNSKEFTIDIMPSIPTDFKIAHQRNHKYADGNQITSFLTSIIKDKYGNVVSDGTYVDFFITNSTGAILKTSGTTIKGIAIGKMVHPDRQDKWTIKAFINGMAKSNQIRINYKSAISDFEINFTQNNRTITVGPLTSFMDQIIPDGLKVSISIYKNNVKLKTLFKESFRGYCVFKLDANNFPSDTYTIKIKVSDLEKTNTNIKL